MTALPPPGRAPALAPGIGRLLLPSPGRAQGRHSWSGPAGTCIVHAVPTPTATRHTQVQHEGRQVTVTSRTWGGPAPEPGSEGGCGKGDAGDRSEREEDRRQMTWREVPGVEEGCTGTKRGHSNSLMAPARSSSPAQTDPGRGTRRSVQGAAGCTVSRDTAAAARALAVSTGLGGSGPPQQRHSGSRDTTAGAVTPHRPGLRACLCHQTWESQHVSHGTPAAGEIGRPQDAVALDGKPSIRNTDFSDCHITYLQICKNQSHEICAKYVKSSHPIFYVQIIP